MARIRTIKPTIWGDAKFAGLTRDARLLTIGLISAADDAGRFIASPAAITGAVYPHDNLTLATVKRWRDEIAGTGLIRLYTVDGREYGWFPRWRAHQKINRPQPSTLPAPPGTADDPAPPAGPGPNGSRNRSRSGSRSGSVNDSRSAHGTSREQFTGGKEGKGSSTTEPSYVATVDARDETANGQPDDAQHAHTAAGELAAHYVAGVPLTDHGRAFRAILQALAAGLDPATIRAGLDRLIAEQRGCTPDQLRIAILAADSNWRPANAPSGRPPGNPYLDLLREHADMTNVITLPALGTGTS